jgi:hypothetical protein
MSKDARDAFIFLTFISLTLLTVALVGLGISYLAAKIHVIEFTGKVDAIAKYANPNDIATVIKRLKR